MRRLDIYITPEQHDKLEELSKQGWNRSFTVRKALDYLFKIEELPDIKKLLEELK